MERQAREDEARKRAQEDEHDAIVTPETLLMDAMNLLHDAIVQQGDRIVAHIAPLQQTLDRIAHSLKKLEERR